MSGSEKARRPKVIAARARGRAAASSAVAKAFLAGVAALERWVERNAASVLRDPRAAIEKMPIERLLGRPLLAAFVPTVGGVVQRAQAPAQKRLDPLTREAARIAREEGARLVVEISATTRKAIRDIVSRGIARNWEIPRVTKALRDVVGLHARYGTAVSNRRDTLIENGVTGEKLEKQVERYKQKLLKSRAYTIARTETAYAESRARYEGWVEQMATGELDDTLHRIWIVGDPCPTCAALSALQPVPMGAPFVLGARSILYPPAHPNCKCTLGLVRMDARAPEGSTQLVGRPLSPPVVTGS